MKKLLLLFLLTSISLNSQKRIVVGYYPSWNKSTFPANAVKYDNLTHIIHSFVYPTTDGNSLIIPSGFEFPALISTAHQKGVKVILGIGGWGQSDGFSVMAADTIKRRKFISDVAAFCKNNGYDGVDLDWEYPKSADRNNMTNLMKELKQELKNINPNMTISIAAPSTDWNNGYDWNEAKTLLDWIGIMTYDFHGSWTNHSGHNSPLYQPKSDADGSADQSLKHYLAKGVSASKLCIGVGFYGWLFTSPSLYSASTAASQVTYTNIIPRLSSGWKYNWDQVSYVPYLTDPNNTQVLTYDDTASVRFKCEYIKNQNLAGMIIWAIGQDRIGGSQPLLETIGEMLLKKTTKVDNGSPEQVFKLEQNYPNPFNSQTRINFSIPSDQSEVRLSVLDILGREIAVILNEHLRAGYYSIQFYPQDISTGIYYYKLNIGRNTSIRKMLYLK